VYKISDKKIKVQFYVGPGDSDEMKFTTRYLSGFPVNLFIFDVNDASSFHALQEWISLMRPRSYMENITPLNFIIGTKTDTPGNRVVLLSDAKEYAQNLEMKYLETRYFL
jgi:hypothetical protein